MAVLQKIDSNITGLRYSEETSLGVANGSAVWFPFEPNTYNNLGGDITTVARNPINASRQRQKGTVVDLNASGGFNTDLTQSNLSDIMQGFMFADLRPKGEELPTATDGSNAYDVASTAGFQAGDMLFASGFSHAGNNGLKHIASIVSNTSITVSETLVAEASPPTGAKIVNVGHKFASGVLNVVMVGSEATMTSSGVQFDTLGLIPGEWVFVGDGNAGTSFVGANNSGFARIHAVAAGTLTLDKTQTTFTNETGTSLTVDIFYGRVLKNESDPSLIKRRTYQIERTLGAPDTTQPTQIQSEYLVGAVPNTAKFNFATANKITVDLDFVAIDNVQRDGVTGVKAGTRPAIVAADAFNTSSDFSRLKMSILDPATSNPSALFAFLTQFDLTINNSVTPDKAISVLGAFEVTAGQFLIDGTATAYFSEVAAIEAVRNNSDVTLDFVLVKANTVGTLTVQQGIIMDVPLMALGGGRLNVSQDKPIDLPLTMAAAADRVFNHSLLLNFFDYLPAVANT